jgi:hypothetical protein
VLGERAQLIFVAAGWLWARCRPAGLLGVSTGVSGRACGG